MEKCKILSISIIQFRSVLTISVLTNIFLGPLSNFVDRGLGEWEWLGPGSTHGRRLTGQALFGAWEILGYGFQDMVFRTWDLNFGAWEILGYGFQDMVFGTWDLNFGAWEILEYGF
jgi:hypothetical protein